MKIRRMRIGAVVASIASLALAAPALGHVTISPETAPSDGFAFLNFAVPHGCEESSTTKLSIQIPRSVPSVTPQRHPLWNLSTKEGPKTKVKLFDETITRGISQVTYTAKEPLKHDELDQLTLEVKLPKGEGKKVVFPTVQTCEQGATRWIQVPAEGQTEEDLEEPAPVVELTAAEKGHGSGGGGDHSGEEEAGAEQASAEVQTAGADAEDDEGAPTWLAILALVVGALGLLAGIGGLTAARRGSA